MSLVSIIFTISFISETGGFGIHTLSPTSIQTITSSSSSNNNRNILWPLLSNSPEVSTVSVCIAELCCCQDGLGGDEILANLLSLNLPYPVDATPCLGACGGGAMVAIDFEDGSNALVAGFEETLLELGLTEDAEIENPVMCCNEEKFGADFTEAKEPPATIFEGPDEVTYQTSTRIDLGETVLSDDKGQMEQIQECPTRVAPWKPVEKKIQVAKDQEQPPKRSSRDLVDVRERMRAEAAIEEQPNPWLNAASYLAGKAVGKLFGEK